MTEKNHSYLCWNIGNFKCFINYVLSNLILTDTLWIYISISSCIFGIINCDNRMSQNFYCSTLQFNNLKYLIKIKQAFSKRKEASKNGRHRRRRKKLSEAKKREGGKKIVAQEVLAEHSGWAKCPSRCFTCINFF